MRLNSHLIPFAILFVFLSCSPERGNGWTERLDAVLRDKSVYEAYFEDRATVLKEVLAEQSNPEHIYSIQMRLADCYRANSNDSVIAYLYGARQTAKEMGSVEKVAIADFRITVTYVKSGYFVEANDILNLYRGRELPSEVLPYYYEAEHKYWGETMAYTSVPQSYDERMAKRDSFRNLLLELVPEGTWQWYFLMYEAAHEFSDIENVRKYTRGMMDVSPENSREWAEAAYYYARSFSSENPPVCEEYLIRSAIVDIMCATKDYSSLNEVSRIFFNKGDIDRAFRYAADHCMMDALYFNGKLRPWQISRFLPEIETAYQLKHAKHSRMINWLLVGMFVLFVILLLLLAFLYKRQQILDSMRTKLEESYLEIDNRNHDLVAINNRLVNLNAKIQEADKVKQEYITLFLGILSDNITSSRQYKNHVLKYIRQGKTKALAEEIEQLPPIDDDILDFYKMFDETFVNIYPDFVRKFNELLVDGAAIVPKGDDILTPELRIFALVKLGITDSSRIASLLHYSANTIYNYRSKIKNKARGSRDGFEEAVRNLE